MAPLFSCSACGREHPSPERQTSPRVDPSSDEAAKLREAWLKAGDRVKDNDPASEDRLVRASVAYFGAVYVSGTWAFPSATMTTVREGGVIKLRCLTCASV